MMIEFITIGVLVAGFVLVVVLGMRRRRRWVHVRILDQKGKPLANEPLWGRFATGAVKATYMGQVGGQAQFRYEAANDPDQLKPIGSTDTDGIFQFAIGISGLRALQLERKVTIDKQSFNYFITVQHVSTEGELRDKPFTVRLWNNGPSLLPDHML